MTLHLSPVLLHAGERLFDGGGDIRLQPVAVTGSPAATNVRYRVGG